MQKNYFFVLMTLITSSFIYGQTESYLPFENRELTIEKIMAGVVFLFVYFIPTIISWKKKNSKYLLLFNLLTSWTVVCWFVAFVWALNISRQHKVFLAEEKKRRKKLKKDKLTG